MKSIKTLTLLALAAAALTLGACAGEDDGELVRRLASATTSSK